MLNVLWLTYSSAPYKNKLFNELGKYCKLTVLFFEDEKTNRNLNEWNYINKTYNIEKINNNYKKQIGHRCKTNDILVDSMYITKFGRYATKMFNKNNKISIMHADGGISKNRGFVINSIMSQLMKKHDYFLSSSIYTDKYYNYYGVKDNIYHYRFTSLTKEDIDRHYEMSTNKKHYRNKLGISKNTVLSVGRPIYSKGFDLLVKAIRGIEDKSFIVVGGKATKKISSYIKENGINNIKFVDLLSSKELEEYYAACDAFILPTRSDVWGLVINEAMSFGLPVITSNKCIAGLHFSDVCEIVNNEDIEGYTKAINNIDCNKGKQGLEIISEYSIENSAKDILEAINSINSHLDSIIN